jgi:hypothetical protein
MQWQLAMMRHCDVEIYLGRRRDTPVVGWM